MNQELYNWLVEDLWASFGYDSPEHHAEVILKHISKKLMEKFIDDLSRIIKIINGGCPKVNTITEIFGMKKQWERELKK